MAFKLVCENRRARHDYDLEESVEAGIALEGSEVKSLREGRANLKDSYCRIREEELFIHNLHISHYAPAGRDSHDPERVRKLLLHKSQLRRLLGKSQERGYTIIPVKLYFKEGLAKVEVALAKGRRLYDKRQEMKKRTMALEIERAVKGRRGRG